MICEKKMMVFSGMSLIALNLASIQHENLVNLCDQESSIIICQRYATSINITGKVLDGYSQHRCLLNQKALNALFYVQKELQKKGYSLVIYDAYRPLSATNSLSSWFKDQSHQKTKKYYYPLLEKKDLVDFGRCLGTSDHESGNSVDVTLIKNDSNLHPIYKLKRKLQDGSEIPFLCDGTVDMGSSYSFFDLVSHYHTPLIEEQYMLPRNYLKWQMQLKGFKNDEKAWWHFTFE